MKFHQRILSRSTELTAAWQLAHGLKVNCHDKSVEETFYAIMKYVNPGLRNRHRRMSIKKSSLLIFGIVKMHANKVKDLYEDMQDFLYGPKVRNWELAGDTIDDSDDEINEEFRDEDSDTDMSLSENSHELSFVLHHTSYQYSENSEQIDVEHEEETSYEHSDAPSMRESLEEEEDEEIHENEQLNENNEIQEQVNENQTLDQFIGIFTEPMQVSRDPVNEMMEFDLNYDIVTNDEANTSKQDKETETLKYSFNFDNMIALPEIESRHSNEKTDSITTQRMIGTQVTRNEDFEENASTSFLSDFDRPVCCMFIYENKKSIAPKNVIVLKLNPDYENMI